MKRSRLPLTALRAFEAAGRHQSFKKAADELAVSEAAVSRQIRELEALLGINLFDRGHRSVKLSESGTQLLSLLTPSFDAIAGKLSELTIAPRREAVFVSVEPTFASLFLIPRLAEWAVTHPDIEIHIDSSAALADVGSDRTTLAIRHSIGDSSWPRTQSKHLFDNFVTPMIAPTLGARPLQLASDLERIRLLRDEHDKTWMRWLATAGVTKSPTWGPVFSNAAIAIQSAELGHGAALGSRRLASRLLQAKSLCAPFAAEIKSGAYWLVAHDFAKLTKSQAIFCDWLVCQISEANVVDKVQQG